MCIFVKTSKAVQPSGLPVLLENIKASRIDGEHAKKILDLLDKFLGEDNEFILEAELMAFGPFSDKMVDSAQIFDIFEQEEIEDSNPYYRIWKDEWCEGESYEIYCKPGQSLRIVRLS